MVGLILGLNGVFWQAQSNAKSAAITQTFLKTNVICEIPISFSQAGLGAKLPVPTLDGKVDLKLPAGTQTHKVFRSRGKGIPYLRNKDRRGDQLVQVIVETPTKLSKEQQELLEKFAEISGEDSAPRSRGFFDKVKDILEGNSAEA